MNRRSFLGAALSAGAAATLPGCRSTGARAPRPRQILVLGGTNFVGPALVERALERGHEVTLFNRGRTRPELFPGCEKLRGDREPATEDLGALEGTRRWDAVVDVWPQRSALVESTARLLAGKPAMLAGRLLRRLLVRRLQGARSASRPASAGSASCGRVSGSGATVGPRTPITAGGLCSISVVAFGEGNCGSMDKKWLGPGKGMMLDGQDWGGKK